KIKSIKAREILNSRGEPTVEVALTTDFGVFQASVPSGASRGKYETVELRDGGKRYYGKGVRIAVKNVNEIIGPKLKGKDPAKQMEIDNLMIKLDGTKNKSKLGGNSILGVSMAICRAGAAAKNLPLYQYIFQLYETRQRRELRSPATLRLPKPCFNVINGGLHAGNELDVQEFMIVPQKKSFSENLKIGTEIYHQIKKNLAKKYGKLATNLGDEGGFAPPIKFPEEAVKLILGAAKKLNYEIKIILDVAASQFLKNGKYKTKIGVFTRDGLLRYYEKLVKNYPILGLEDPFAEDDWEGWKALSPLNSKLLIIGDDLTVTNPERIREAKEKEVGNAMIVKINQIGTVTEALEAVKLAISFGWKIIVSHRSGETNDDFIADFAVGISADFIKSGAPARGERVVIYNRLLRIEEELTK
ncbi:phosphopyruvate hydratase, partial [Patescibacteria group bacterium]|nr:phosphopyruvate hydratase [Patescibacteria group bacterium]